jgi:uncharacterized protein (DUF983 family)
VSPDKISDNRFEVVRGALRRGLSKRCPHCGKGPLFSGWARHLERCPVCGLVYERNPGDTWAFTIIGDRLPIAVIVMLTYFGLARSHPAIGIASFIVIGVVLVWTSPNRWGAGIALHYVSRLIWPDPQDPVPARANSEGALNRNAFGQEDTKARTHEESYGKHSHEDAKARKKRHE